MDRDHVLPIARGAAEDLARDGAGAGVLVGSHARGDDGPDSDLDILAVGPETFSCRLARRGGLLVSTGSRPLDSYRRDFGDPGAVGAAVPGWREAVILHDPAGTAASLAREAQAWRWGPLERRCDLWVAEQVTALAEEVHKLVTALRHGDRSTTASSTARRTVSGTS